MWKLKEKCLSLSITDAFLNKTAHKMKAKVFLHSSMQLNCCRKCAVYDLFGQKETYKLVMHITQAQRKELSVLLLKSLCKPKPRPRFTKFPLNQQFTKPMNVSGSLGLIVFAFRRRKFSHQTKLFFLQFALPFTLQQYAGAPETTNIWNPIPEWDLLNVLSSCVNWQTTKPVTAVTMLMLMLVQVYAFCSSCHRTLSKHFSVHPKQVKYHTSLWRRIQVFVS